MNSIFRRALPAVVVALGFCPLYARAAVLFSNVDPAVTDISFLPTSGVSTSFVGAFEDSLVTGGKNTWAHAPVITPATQGVLRQVTIPLSVASSSGLRMEVYEIGSSVTFTNGATISDFSQITLIDSATKFGVPDGASWVTFDFTADGDEFTLSTAKQYAFLLEVTDVHGQDRAQLHYWLGRIASGGNITMLQEKKVYPVNSATAENDWGVTTAYLVRGPGIYVSDVAPVGVPMILRRKRR